MFVFCLGNCCRSCMTRIPYATMIATVMCLIGVAIFCTSMYRGASLMIIMFDRVFRFRLFWIEAVQMIFVTIGASMAGLGFMILFVGCLATGSTRYKVYRAWRSRVGGRISCAVVSIFMHGFGCSLKRAEYLVNEEWKDEKNMKANIEKIVQLIRKKYFEYFIGLKKNIRTKKKCEIDQEKKFRTKKM